MPTTEDIREALARNDIDLAEKLIEEVGAKRHGTGLSNHDRQIFARQIARTRAANAAVVPEPEKAPPPPPRQRVFRPAAKVVFGEQGIEVAE